MQVVGITQLFRNWSKSMGGGGGRSRKGVGRSREGVGHQFLNPW